VTDGAAQDRSSLAAGLGNGAFTTMAAPLYPTTLSGVAVTRGGPVIRSDEDDVECSRREHAWVGFPAAAPMVSAFADSLHESLIVEYLPVS